MIAYEVSVMNLQSFLVLLVIFVLLALAILFICQNGGWHSSCTGNCASCREHCPDKGAANKDAANKGNKAL